MSNISEFLETFSEKPKANPILSNVTGLTMLQDRAISEKVDFNLFPSRIQTFIDEIAKRVLEADNRKTIVVGFPFAGKTFFIEQFAFHIDRYLERSKINGLYFIKVSNNDVMMNFGPQESFLERFNQWKLVNKKTDRDVVFVTESIEAAQILSHNAPSARIILEMNSGAYMAIAHQAPLSLKKEWSSWELIDADYITLEFDDLCNLMTETIIARLNEEYPIKLEWSDAYEIISAILEDNPEAVQYEDCDEHGEETWVNTPPGVWAVLIKHFFAGVVYTTNPDLLLPNGGVDAREIVSRILPEARNLLSHWVQSEENGLSEIDLISMGMPREMAHMIANHGNGPETQTSKAKAPVKKLVFSEIDKLAEKLKKSIFGQDEAIEQVVESLYVPAAGLGDSTKPIKTFLFLGRTGVGKTELTLKLAESVSDPPLEVVRIDLSEYQQEHEVSKLFGSPPGYVGYEEGGRLTGAVLKNPNCVILLDEVEKAHPKIWDAFLQVFDKGRLTDNKGVEVDFTQSIIVLTSNIGADKLNKNVLGFNSGSVEEQYKVRQTETDKIIKNELEKVFRPEFINRIDEVIVFKELSETVIKNIVRKEFNLLRDRCREHGAKLYTYPVAIDEIVKRSDISKYGAREIQRVVSKNLSTIISKFMLNNPDEKTIKVGFSDNEFTVVGNGR